MQPKGKKIYSEDQYGKNLIAHSNCTKKKKIYFGKPYLEVNAYQLFFPYHHSLFFL